MFTKPFDDLSETSQLSLKDLAELAVEEIPVIAYFRDRYTWTLLSNQRLIWSYGETTRSLDLEELVAATVSSGHLVDIKNKSDMSELLVSTVDGDTFKVSLEPGGPFFGFWNVLKLVAR